MLIARDNDTRAALNAAAREHVRALGQLGDDVDYGPVTVAVGDRIICRRNDRFADPAYRHAHPAPTGASLVDHIRVLDPPPPHSWPQPTLTAWWRCR